MRFSELKDLLLEEFVIGDSFVVNYFNDCEEEEEFNLLLKEDVAVSVNIKIDGELEHKYPLHIAYGLNWDKLEYISLGVMEVRYNGNMIIRENILYVVDDGIAILPLTAEKHLARERYCLYEQINYTLFRDSLNKFYDFVDDFGIRAINATWNFEF